MEISQPNAVSIDAEGMARTPWPNRTPLAFQPRTLRRKR
jgi:hypothetical protein